MLATTTQTLPEAPTAEQPTISAVRAESARVAVATPPVTATRGPAQLEIIVSLDDIRDGVQGDSSQCAVALAVKRVGHRRVSVDGGFIMLVDGVIYSLTEGLVQWIRTFDHDRRGVQPERWVLRPTREVPS